MNKKILWIVGVVIVVIIIISALGKSKSGSDTINIGIIAPLTGTAASYGTEGKNAVVLALEEINASGGIAGKQVKYFVEDGKCDAKTALDAWNKLVSVDKVEAVFGGHCSTETLAIAALSVRDHVPVFAVFATAPVVPNEGEWLFRHVSTNEYYAKILAEQAYKKGYRSVAVITELKDFPVTYSDAFIKTFKELGGTIALDERFDPQTKDYRTEALKLKGRAYDAVFVSTQGPDVMGIVTAQIHDLGLEKAYLYSHALSGVPYVTGTHGYIPQNMIIVGPYTDPQSAKMKVFNDAYTARYGSLYNFNPYFIAADYDIVHRFKDAADTCAQTSGYSIDCVRDQFKNATSYFGVAGEAVISSQYSPKGILTPVGLITVLTGGKTRIEPIK